MTDPANDYEAQHAQPVDNGVETEAERVARQQKETQAAGGDTETRNAGSMNAQNTPGPETQE